MHFFTAAPGCGSGSDGSVVAGLSHYKNRVEKQRAGGVLSAPRLDNQAGCKTERLHGLSGPYDKNYGRKRVREPSLDRTDSESLRSGTPVRTRLVCGSLTLLLLGPPVSPKLFLDSSSPCTTLPNMHPALHSPLTRQLSTSSENSTPFGPGTVSSTPVRVRLTGSHESPCCCCLLPLGSVLRKHGL